MNTKTINTPNFTGRAVEIIAEILARTCVDKIDAEVIEEIVQASLNEYYMMLNGYYEEEYYNALNTVRNSAYESGYESGYDAGYDVGYNVCYETGLSAE